MFRVMCTMYGLKEASMQFYVLMSAWLLSMGWKYGKSDRCLFIRGNLLVGLSTDDLLTVDKVGDGVELHVFIA